MLLASCEPHKHNNPRQLECLFKVVLSDRL